MTDQELLELAAKAAGREPILCYESARNLLRIGTRESYYIWRPLTEDGAAFRLMCQLNLSLNSNSASVGVGGYTPGLEHVYAQEPVVAGDQKTAHRRAIVRAAAMIGASL